MSRISDSEVAWFDDGPLARATLNSASLPTPPFTSEEKEVVAAEVYAHVWQQAVSGLFEIAA